MFNFPALTRLFEGHKGSKVPSEVSDEWDLIQEGLEKFEECPEFEMPASTVKNITRLHWKKSSECHVCSNPVCKRGLWATSKHHCRRCGNIFCAQCTKFQRLLSPNAAYDPNGWPFKVCEKCYYYEPQTVGFSRTQTDYFEGWRAAKHLESKVLTRPPILRNLKNLVEGFEVHYKPPPPTPSTRPPRNTSSASEDPTAAIPPQVRKHRELLASSLFKGMFAMRQGSMGAACQCCDRPYPALEQQHNCRVCGKLVCKAQSTLDLLLYKPDPVDQALAGSHARWALIRVVGSPEVEPDHRLYLRVCQPCQDQLQIIQVQEYQRLTQGQGLVNLCWEQMMAIYQDIMSIRSKIDHQLPEFQETVAKVEAKTRGPEVTIEPDSHNKEQLTKYQSELSHHLSVFVAVISRLKELHPQTQGQVILLKNILKCQQRYYMDMDTRFKQLQAQLKQITPNTVHQQIMDFLETEALNSACASLNQLEVECRYLCETHHLDLNIPVIIKETAEMVEIEMKEKMEGTGEDWSEQKEELDEFVHIQLEGIPEANILPQRMIQPSAQLLRRLGSFYLQWLVSRKAFEVIGRIRLQLMIRNAAKASLLATNESLDRLTQSAQEVSLKEESIEED
ncbi:uncharacterized protein LOC100891924 isoform X3 [Strongylocentrotus purpuratus]|uniref:FYVE-type domain-containing protein n=1 Tax=Strongylocentrotus purpuratus TaxID=7668 RepID=A0A7M7NR19_STRPU|nr:uncharacterized protein LOC100891924 isoform X3 [Strongylocentrotus purpuratus]